MAVPFWAAAAWVGASPRPILVGGSCASDHREGVAGCRVFSFGVVGHSISGFDLVGNVAVI